MIRIALLPGDGIGQEVLPPARAALEATAAALGVSLRFIPLDLGADRFLREGVGLPADVPPRLLQETDAILLGALGDPRIPSGAHAREILLGLRTGLDLYLNVRPIRLLHPRLCPLKGKSAEDVDMWILRENTEGAYIGAGARMHRGTEAEVATHTALYTRRGVDRALRGAFAWARDRGLGRVCLGDKHNALEQSHGLWYERFLAIAPEFPGVAPRHRFADTLLLEMITRPEDFDVIVAPNLMGDLISEVGAALMGGLGLAPSMSLHPGRPGLYEPIHGSAPDIAGRGVANPMAAIWCGGLLLERLGHPEGLTLIEGALAGAIAGGQTTPDLGGSLSTGEVAAAVIDRIRRSG